MTTIPTDPTTRRPNYQTILLPGGTPLEMVAVTGGHFHFGELEEDATEDQRPEISVPNFWLGKYPVTNAQYNAFVAATGHRPPEWREPGNDYHYQTGTEDHYRPHREALEGPNYPVVGVDWHDAVAFCAWLSATTGEHYALPSEAMWEYAAKGGAQQQPYLYAGSHQLKQVGWYDGNSNGSWYPVGQKLSNTLGLYDLSGNVYEWCADHWHSDEKIAEIPRNGKPWIDKADESLRVVRGGSWDSLDGNCEVSGRNSGSTDIRYDRVGFRLSRYAPF